MSQPMEVRRIAHSNHHRGGKPYRSGSWCEVLRFWEALLLRSTRRQEEEHVKVGEHLEPLSLASCFELGWCAAPPPHTPTLYMLCSLLEVSYLCCASWNTEPLERQAENLLRKLTRLCYFRIAIKNGLAQMVVMIVGKHEIFKGKV